ncbi:MAG: hypothetical protein IJ842_05090 [Bacilli bacterium]|nr:hypothetical protein [Bacilli bacterium]
MKKMRRIVKKRQLLNKRLVLNIILVLFMFLSIGYSTLSTNLNINGNLNVKKYYEKTLYNVLAKEAETGGLATKYTGAHHDSFTDAPSKDIYHWYATNDTQGTQILDKNNVIFADHCWQMIRTTDTGGVKMIYNGEAENNQCLNTRGTHPGYSGLNSEYIVGPYWYGTDYTYDSSTQTFKVSGTTEKATMSDSTASGLVGKYTCKSENIDDSCAAIVLIDSYNAPNTNVIAINSNSHYSQFGTLEFNASAPSPAHVGYMYNTVYTSNSKSMTSTEVMFSSNSLSTSYWYADSVTWGSPTANRYNLDNPDQVTSTANYPSLVGKYTFRNATQTYTNSNVYYIVAVNNSTMYYITLSNSGNHTLSDFNYTYTYGDSFTDNGDGTYTINNPTTIERKDWYTSYSSVGANKYVCKNAVNDTCSYLWYTTATSNTSMTYISSSKNYKYAKGFTWDGSKYVLNNDTSTTFFDWNETNKTSINNAHYTCWNDTGECTTISYIYYMSGTKPYYINITNGKSVEDAVNEMLYDDGVNQVNSTMKSGVDAWYKHYLLEDYSDYLEDTIFCNDRSISSLGGWNPDGGMTNTYLQFKNYNVSSDLSCTNTTDKFSVSNNKAKLTYKVGLMSSSEINILNNDNVRKAGRYYWLASPYFFNIIYYAYSCVVTSSGHLSNDGIYFSQGLRPAVSLKPGTVYLSGDGFMEHPYVVDTN